MLDYEIQPIPNFSLREVRCKCGCGLVILQPELLICTYNLRMRYGKPVIMRSWTRCLAHNEAVGGKGDSYHLFGKANDPTPADGINDRFRAICHDCFPYVLDYDDFCHCDTRGKRRP